MKTSLFPKGVSGNPSGRPAGAKDKLQSELKSMILQALDAAGGVDYLTEQAEKNPGAFLALLAKVLPKEIRGDLNHNHAEITKIEYVIVNPQSQ